MKYKGSCHCGQVKFEAEGELKQVLACNCSICSRKGPLMWFLAGVDFASLSVQHFNGRAL